MREKEGFTVYESSQGSMVELDEKPFSASNKGASFFLNSSNPDIITSVYIKKP